MQLSVPLENGYLADKFGKYATGENLYHGMPKRSFPITILDAPQATKTFALWLIDWDAVPVGGLPWIHWNAANIPGDVTLIPEDASRSGVVAMTQGHNAHGGALAHSDDPIIANGYVGPQPPNADHDYTLTIFALDTRLDLEPGFWLNEARHAMAGHIIAQASLELPSRV